MNAIVITFDSLPASFLGCCGNEWIRTPAFDRLAAGGVSFPQYFADDPGPWPVPTPAWWSDRFACRKRDPSRDLFTTLTQHGVTARLLCESTAQDPVSVLAGVPAELMTVVEGRDGLDLPAEKTPFVRLVHRGLSELRLLQTSRREPWLLWLKSRGVPCPWLPPRDFATQFLDLEEDADRDEEQHDDLEDDESLVEMSTSEFDALLTASAALPDTREGRDALTDLERGLIRKVFGGYVAMLDAALGELLDAAAQAAGNSPTLLVVTGARGAVVREPGVLRGDWERLAQETVHVPLWMQSPELDRGIRRQGFVQPADLFATLLDWFGARREPGGEGHSLLPVARGEAMPRPFAVTSDGGRFAGIQTSDFYLVVDRHPPDSGLVSRRLFVKPDDFWEVNNVVDQFPDSVAELSQTLERFLIGEPGKESA